MFPSYENYYYWDIPYVVADTGRVTTNVYKLAKNAKKPNRQVKKEKKYVRR